MAKKLIFQTMSKKTRQQQYLHSSIHSYAKCQTLTIFKIEWREKLQESVHGQCSSFKQQQTLQKERHESLRDGAIAQGGSAPGDNEQVPKLLLLKRAVHGIHTVCLPDPLTRHREHNLPQPTLVGILIIHLFRSWCGTPYLAPTPASPLPSFPALTSTLTS